MFLWVIAEKIPPPNGWGRFLIPPPHSHLDFLKHKTPLLPLPREKLLGLN